ncbi:MAG: hypothetical protein J7K21_00035, partial [Desulfurococcales archaeon]|nr:hypothetical protein [Desulfurococcales archaeon]
MSTKRLHNLKIHYVTIYENYISKIFDTIYDYANTINEPKITAEKTVIERADQLDSVIDQAMERGLNILHLYVDSQLLYRILKEKEINVELLIITIDHYYLGCKEELIHDLADVLLNKHMRVGNVFIIYT